MSETINGMRVIDWPEDLVPAGCAFWLNANTGGSRNPLTGVRKTYQNDPFWQATLKFNAYRRAGDGLTRRGPRLDALIADLEGGATLVRFWDFWRPYSYRLQQYYAQQGNVVTTFSGGETFANGEGFSVAPLSEPTSEFVAPGDDEIVFSGFAASQPMFDSGDYFEMNGRPRLVMDDVVSDAQGRARVRFRPAAREKAHPGTARVTQSRGLFQLTDNGAGANLATRSSQSGWTLEFEEYLL